MSEHQTYPIPAPFYRVGESKNENPYGHSGIEGMFKGRKQETDYLRWLFQAKENILEEHERLMLKQLEGKKHTGKVRLHYTKKTYPLSIDVKSQTDKVNKEIISFVSYLINGNS